MDSRWDHTKYEEEIYKKWEESGAFAPPSGKEAKKKNLKPFTIIMPPPNANDPLHVGHAMFVSLEDILIRFNRMKGKASLWLPGTDHAGIETQYVFEKKLSKQGKSRFDYDRETLYKMIWDYVQENGQVAVNQMKHLGASADWERFKFTLDEDIVGLVLETFEKLHNDGLIYRAEKLVNYCTKCGTSYSELEVEHEERIDPLYYMKYGPFTLATVRPETKFGDTAVAVNPKDSRYKQWIGKEVEVEGLIGKFKVRVIADEAVDPEFGTGVVKVTPAHDFADFEMGQRHGLEMKQVIGFDGKLTERAGRFAGLSVNKAREVVVEEMKEKGMMVKIDEKYKHRVGTCYRCHRVIEPLPKKQFFIKVEPLVKKVLKALDEKEVKIHGAGREKILRHWLTNLRDWNVSRQIVWGIRIPVWYPKNPKQNGDFVVSIKNPGKGYVQEEDTFDTWFSSGQWPVVTLKTSKQPGDFDFYYPTSVMETGYDILPFWVMRMLMLGIYLTGKAPFKDVYLHGLVRDEAGRKMSKSIGNVINPLDMVNKYGADAVRMALVMSSVPGQDKAVGENTIRGMRNFSNKVWNASRFVKMMEKESKKEEGDVEFKKHLDGIIKKVSKNLGNLRIGQAAELVHNEFWHWFCDEEIEKAKQGEVGFEVLEEGLKVFLKLLHPFMPFVTEAVWKEAGNKTMLISEKWPK